MTRLTKLGLKNFKSFKKAEVPISKGFTAIVGSNGSGKSNILDGLLFVLGMTSLKTLRASRLTDLVNNSTKENYAKVTLSLKDKGKNYEVSRMIDKQGKSIYRLDGKRTTLNEINSLLLELGIDVSAHNIITQGDITRVIEMSPIERRGVIDGIAGLSEFNEKRDEAIKELGKVDARIKEATIVLNERKTFLAELEQEMGAAKEFEELEKEKKQLKATVIGKELESLGKRLKEVNQKISSLKKDLSENESEVSEQKSELEKLKKTLSGLNNQMLKASEETYSKFGQAFEETKARLQLEKEKIEMNQELLKKNSEKIGENNELLKKLAIEKKEMDKKRSELRARLRELNPELEKVSEEKKKIGETAQEKTTELSKREKGVDSMNMQVEELRKEIFELEVFARQWEKQKDFNSKKLSELSGERAFVKEELEKINEKKEKIRELTAGRDLPRAIASLEKKIEFLIGEKNRHLALSGQEKKAIDSLKKALSKCPTCDSEIEKGKKEEIIKLKAKTAAEAEAKAKSLEEKITEEKKGASALKERLTIASQLSAEVSHEKTVESKLASVEKRIQEIKGLMDKKTVEDQITKRNKLNEKMKGVILKRESARENLKLFRSQNIFESFTRISKTMEGLVEKKNSIESKLAEINSRLREGITPKEKELAEENGFLESETASLETKVKKQEGLVEKLEKEVSEKEKEINKSKEKSVGLVKEKEKGEREIEKKEKQISGDLTKTKKIESDINELNIDGERTSVRIADLEEEAKEFEGVEQIYEKSPEELRERIPVVEKRLEELGAVNLKAVENFNDLKKDVDDIQGKADKLEEEHLAVLDMIDKIEVKRTEVFMNCFNAINKNFMEMFFRFFNGEGRLGLSNEENPLESGLIIDARHRGEKLQNIDSMSGGEKTLTALAFVFAIQFYMPAPFYAFDEADAALDKENSLKVSELIGKIAEKSQFIAITHNDPLIKKADQVIGVALSRDKSSVIGLKLKNRKS